MESMNPSGSAPNSSQRKSSQRRRLADAWYFPILGAIGFAIVLAASITSPDSPDRWHNLLVTLVSVRVIIPTIGGLAAGYVAWFYLQHRKAAGEKR